MIEGHNLSAARALAPPLAAATQGIERSFVTAGMQLDAALTALRGLQPAFTALEDAFGPDATAALGAAVADTAAAAARVGAGLGLLLDDTGLLAARIARIQAEITALDQVIRTIAIVAVNARVQGALLVPPRPQVSAFLGRLAEMSAAAEAALAMVKDGSTTVSRDLGALGTEGQALRKLVDRQLLPALAAQGQEAETRVARQGDLAALTAARAADVAALRAEVGRIVHGLQTGDATRQRLDNAARALEPIPPHDGLGSLGPRLRLSAVLIRGALADTRPSVVTALDALQAIRVLAAGAVGPTATGFLDRARDGADGTDLGDLELPRRHLETMRTIVAKLAEGFGVILGLEGTLPRIAHEVRLAGLNATVICARLGHEGRGLRELAQWLHGLTDESDAIVLRLQDDIAAARDLARRLGSEQIDGLAQGLADVSAAAPRLAELTGVGIATVAAARAAVGQAGQSVPGHLNAAQSALTGFAAAGETLAGLADRLEMAGTGLPEGPDTAAAFDWLRARYTVPVERVLHDALARTVGAADLSADTPPPPAEAPPVDQTLDDIFF